MPPGLIQRICRQTGSFDQIDDQSPLHALPTNSLAFGLCGGFSFAFNLAENLRPSIRKNPGQVLPLIITHLRPKLAQDTLFGLITALRIGDERRGELGQIEGLVLIPAGPMFH